MVWFLTSAMPMPYTNPEEWIIGTDGVSGVVPTPITNFGNISVLPVSVSFSCTFALPLGDCETSDNFFFSH